MATRINLVVASGAHEGKAIPVTAARFVIGRDPDCSLRPASPAVSKKHTEITIRDGKIWAKDLGSTNGTFVNGDQLSEERELAHGDQLKVGPLEFTLELVRSKSSTATSPVKSPAEKPTDPEVPSSMTPTTPDPMPSVKSDNAARNAPKADADVDAAAAMLLGMDDDDPSIPTTVPEGSTVHEMPAVDMGQLAADGKAGSDPKQKPIRTSAETSNAANEILKKYMRRQK